MKNWKAKMIFHTQELRWMKVQSTALLNNLGDNNDNLRLIIKMILSNSDNYSKACCIFDHITRYLPKQYSQVDAV